MGRLVDGVWRDEWYDTKKTGGRFVRSDSAFRNWITPDGTAGPSGEGGFAAVPGRYHLYVSYACPWAHRTLIVRALKKLEQAIPVSVVDWYMGEQGWTFTGQTGSTGDALYGLDCLHEIYTKADPHYSGRVTVPVLWDTERETIVNNESAEIIRMFNHAFDELAADGHGNPDLDLTPPDLLDEIDALNARIYDTVNNGVYKCGFATTQQAYEEAFASLFETLDWLEERLSRRRFLTGAIPTEADWRLFTTLVRFDAVYVGHFKCNLRRIADYPNLSGYLRDLYQQPGIAPTVHFDHIKHHYYESHKTINPTGIVPVGPEMFLSEPPGREHLIPAANRHEPTDKRAGSTMN